MGLCAGRTAARAATLTLSLLVAGGAPGCQGAGSERIGPACDEQVYLAALDVATVRLDAAISRLSPYPTCLRGQLVQGMTRLLQGNTDDGVRLLEQAEQQAGDDPLAAALAGELIGAELAVAHEGARRDEARAAVERALGRAPHAFQARLLHALLLAQSSREVAVPDLVALAAAAELPADVNELFLKDLAAWMVAILGDGRELPPDATPATRRAVARLLSQLAEHRSGGSHRQLRQAAIHQLELARRGAGSVPSEEIALEAGQYWDLLDFPAEITLLRGHLAQHPSDRQAWLLQLQALDRVGRYAEAIQPGSPGAEACPPCVVQVAKAHARLGDGLEFEPLLDLHRRFPQHPEVLSLLGASLIQRGKPEDGVALLQQSLAASPQDLSTLNLLAATLHRLGRRGEAEVVAGRYRVQHEAFEQANRAGEAHSNAASSYEEARVALGRGDLQRVQQLCSFIEEREPRFALLPLLRMALSLKQGVPPRPEDTQDLLDAALTLNSWLVVKR